MNKRIGKFFHWCTKYGQLFICTLMVFTFISLVLLVDTSYAQTGVGLQLRMLNPSYRGLVRGPANFVPSTEIEVRPVEDGLWVDTAIERDTSGILGGTKGTIEHWAKQEEYARKWNLQSTGLFETPDMESRKNYLQKRLLKYLDKKLAGEIRNAEEGSTLHSVGQAHQALRPKTKVQISKNIKIRLKARVLQGKAIIKVENPYVEYETRLYASSGSVKMFLKREFASIGVTTNIDYDVTGETWIAAVNKPLNERWNARYTSSQSDSEMAFSEHSDQRYELLYSLPF